MLLRGGCRKILIEEGWNNCPAWEAILEGERPARPTDAGHTAGSFTRRGLAAYTAVASSAARLPGWGASRGLAFSQARP